MAIGYKITNLDYSSFVTENSYKLYYTPNTIVHALPYTLGLFFFGHRRDAVAFGKWSGNPFLLIEVEGKPTKARHAYQISADCSDYGLERYYNAPSEQKSTKVTAPIGTILIDSLRVTNRITEYLIHHYTWIERPYHRRQDS